MAVFPPIVQATMSACLLAVLSNVVAQCITSADLYGDSTSRPCKTYTSEAYCAANETSFDIYHISSLLDWRPVLEFALFAILNAPPNFLWQEFLESKFPSYTLRPSTIAIRAAATNDEQTLDESEKSHTILESQLDRANTAYKFLLDQSVGAALNTLAFSLAMAAFRGEDWPAAVLTVRRDFWPLMNAGWKLWPVVSGFNFLFVKSVQMRSLVGNLAGVGWSVYLSLATRRKGDRWSESHPGADSVGSIQYKR